MELKHQWPPRNNALKSHKIKTQSPHITLQESNSEANADTLPDPRGKKSLPTTLSSTEDFPELCSHINEL